MRQPTKHDPHPEGKLARSLFGAAFMSDTKWRKLFQIVHQKMLGIDRVRVKFVGVDGLKTMRFPPSLQCPHAYMDPVEFGPTELRSIEWLEIDADISAPLAAVGQFPLTVNDGRSRVTGYGDPRRGNGS